MTRTLRFIKESLFLSTDLCLHVPNFNIGRKITDDEFKLTKQEVKRFVKKVTLSHNLFQNAASWYNLISNLHNSYLSDKQKVIFAKIKGHSWTIEGVCVERIEEYYKHIIITNWNVSIGKTS